MKCIYSDRKIFKAYVRMHRIDQDGYLLEGFKINGSNAIQNVKKCISTTRKKMSDFDRYLQRNKSRCIKRSINTIDNSKKKYNAEGDASSALFKKESDDVKLAKKAIVVLYDCFREWKFKNDLNQLIGNPINSIESQNINLPLNRIKSILQQTEPGVSKLKANKKILVENFSKHPNRCMDLNNELRNSKYNIDVTSEFSRNETKYQGRLASKRKIDHNWSLKNNLQNKKLSNTNALSVQDVSSSMIPQLNSATMTSPETYSFCKQSNLNINKSRDFGYCINSYNKPTFKNNRFIHTSGSAETQYKTELKKATKANRQESQNFDSLTLDRRSQEEIEDNQVTSTQDHIHVASHFVCLAMPKIVTETDIQNNYIDTTLKESIPPKSAIQMNNSNDRKKKKNDFKLESSDIPSTTTLVGRIKPLINNLNEISNSSNSVDCDVSIEKKCVISGQSLLTTASDYEPLINLRNRFTIYPSECHVAALEKQCCFMDVAKTYSSINFSKTIFVPPDVEKIIEAEDRPF